MHAGTQRPLHHLSATAWRFRFSFPSFGGSIVSARARPAGRVRPTELAQPQSPHRPMSAALDGRPPFGGCVTSPTSHLRPQASQHSDRCIGRVLQIDGRQKPHSQFLATSPDGFSLLAHSVSQDYPKGLGQRHGGRETNASAGVAYVADRCIKGESLRPKDDPASEETTLPGCPSALRCLASSLRGLDHIGFMSQSLLHLP